MRNIFTFLPRILFFTGLVLTTLVVTTRLEVTKVFSAASHIVISEIQIEGNALSLPSTDEFVELYNPTSSDINLSEWRLTKKTLGGLEQDLVTTISGTIKAHGYFLIAHANYNDATNPDMRYTTPNSVAGDNTVLLYGPDKTTIIDFVGMGQAVNRENVATVNPASNRSIERKALETSTVDSMALGGADSLKGNGHDSDNNSLDFVTRVTPQPQNSGSATELESNEVPTPTPTDGATPTLTPTNTPTPTVEVSPTPTATPTQEPTTTPTNTPTTTPTPTDEVTPTPTPTESVTPTLTPTNEPSPSATPTVELSPSPTTSTEPTPTVTTEPSNSPTPTTMLTPTPTPSGSFTFFSLTCRRHYLSFSFFNRVIRFPHVVCSVI